MDTNGLFDALGVSTGAEDISDTQSVADSDEDIEAEGGTEQELAEPAEDTDGEAQPEKGKTRQSKADNQKFARQRRERERQEAIDAARIEERQRFNNILKNAGLVDPTSKNGKIESVDQLEQRAAQRAAKNAAKALADTGELTEEQLTELLQTTESGRKLLSANAAAQADKAAVYRQQQLELIAKIDPTIKNFEDLRKIPEYEAFESYVRNNGLSWQDAYRLAAVDRLAQKGAAAERQKTLNGISGKSHRTQDAARGGEGIDLPKEIDEMYKAMFPGLTYEQRVAKYGEYLGRTKKGS